MATSTVRAVILVVAVVIGVLVIRNAFPENASQSITTPGPSTPRTSNPSPTPTTSAASSPTTRRRPKDITVQVLNGTDTIGLAGTVTQQLKKAGYNMRDAGNVKTASKTTIFYQQGFKAEADFLRQKRFPGAVVAQVVSPVPSGFSASVNITIVLGLNFSPSPS